MDPKKKRILKCIAGVYVLLVVAFLGYSMLRTRGEGVERTLDARLQASNEVALTEPYTVESLKGRKATPEIVAALTEAGVATVAVQGNPKAQVSPALVERGDVFADVVLPAHTKLTPQLWAAVLTSEVEFLTKQGRTASVYASGAADILGFDWTLVFIIANFLGLLSLLYLLLWEPIVKVLDERSAQIEGDLKSARESRELAAALKKEYDALMLGAKQERQALIADGQKEGQNEKQRILAEARRDADKIIQQTRQELVAAAEKARRQLRAEIGGLSVELAGKILAREIREEDNRRLVDDFVTAIGGSERGN